MATKRRSTSGGSKAARRRLNMDRAREKGEEIDNRSSNEFHEIKEGWNYFFIMPPWEDDVEVIWKEVEQHGLLVCPKRASDGKKDCPVCTELRKSKDSDFTDQFQLRSRGFFNAIRKADIKKKDPDCVGILALSSARFRDVIDYINDEEKDISNPKAAVPVGLHRRGKGKRTRYKLKFGEPVDISAYLTDRIMDALYNLDDMKFAQPASVKELRKAIRGAADDEDDFDDDDLEGEEEIDGEEEFSEEDDLLSEPDGDEVVDDEDEDAEELEDDEELDESEFDDDEEAEIEEEDEPEEAEKPKRKSSSGRRRVREGDSKRSTKTKRRARR